MKKKTKIAHRAGFDHYYQYIAHVRLTCLNSIYAHPKYRTVHENRLFRFRASYVARKNNISDYFYINNFKPYHKTALRTFTPFYNTPLTYYVNSVDYALTCKKVD